MVFLPSSCMVLRLERISGTEATLEQFCSRAKSASRCRFSEYSHQERVNAILWELSQIQDHQRTEFTLPHISIWKCVKEGQHSRESIDFEVPNDARVSPIRKSSRNRLQPCPNFFAGLGLRSWERQISERREDCSCASRWRYFKWNILVNMFFHVLKQEFIHLNIFWPVNW
jgi:hypothetical protein